MSIISDPKDVSVDTVNRDLLIRLEPKFGMGPTKYIHPYTLINQQLYLPFAYATRVLHIARPERKTFPVVEKRFVGKLRPEQQLVRKEAVRYLNRRGSIMISAYPGFGKTCTAIHLAISIRLRTLIIVNKIVLMRQWEDSVTKFCPDAVVHRVTAKSTKKPGDFYIINAQNVEKKGRAFFKDVGAVIVDEAHMIMAETLSRCMQHICPRYLIGLTATPYRPDGLDILLQFYFGNRKIIRKLHRKHTVYRVETGFVPKIEKTIQGRINWGSILDQQAKCIPRNELIISIIEKYPQRNFLVLVKRVWQGEYLIRRLTEKSITVTSLIGGNQEFEVHARVLIGTCQKVGTGFDHPKLDTLILAADVQEYFIQYLGRIFRVEDSAPVVFDLVDNNRTLLKHYQTRVNVYQEHGGVIKIYKRNKLR